MNQNYLNGVSILNSRSSGILESSNAWLYVSSLAGRRGLKSSRFVTILDSRMLKYTDSGRAEAACSRLAVIGWLLIAVVTGCVVADVVTTWLTAGVSGLAWC